MPFPLRVGPLDGLNLHPGTSGITIASDFLSIPFAFGSVCDGGPYANTYCTADADCPSHTCVLAEETLALGKERGGLIPVVVKTSSVRIPVLYASRLGLGTTCVSGVAPKTCGGTLFLADGKTLSPGCTPRFS